MTRTFHLDESFKTEFDNLLIGTSHRWRTSRYRSHRLARDIITIIMYSHGTTKQVNWAIIRLILPPPSLTRLRGSVGPTIGNTSRQI